MKGKFITLEGGEGSGKTTLIQRLVPYLNNQGIDVLTTREPGGVKTAEKIRDLLLDNDPSISISPRTELLLYLASRNQHLEEKVFPALEKGIWVLCDRFNDSSLAYQGYARGLGLDYVAEIAEALFRDFTPHLTLYLDVDPKIGLSRSSKITDNNKEDRMEKESLSFHQKVREGYYKVLDRHPDRVLMIDASQSVDASFDQAIIHLQKRGLLAP